MMGAPVGNWDGLMNPLARLVSMYVFKVSNSPGPKL